MFFKCLIFNIMLVLWSFYLRIDQISCNELCWNNEHECNIETELFKNLEFSNGITMQIDCRLNLQDHLKEDENEMKRLTENLFVTRFVDVQAVVMDGCQTPLNVYTYGMEFLPICNNITKASIKHFHTDILRPLNCNRDIVPLQLEYLIIQFNEIAVIGVESFQQNYLQLRDVVIEKNSLKVIHEEAFNSIRSLENLYIANEPALILKSANLFEHTNIAHIHLETLKQMTSAIFNHLPKTLQNLYVANTPLVSDEVLVRNSLSLRNLTIRKCSVKIFTLYDSHSTINHIDLSGNVMATFTAYQNNLTELNLDNNHLKRVPFEWFANLTSLKTILLKGNQIKILCLHQLLKALPNAQTFDVSHNHLKSLQDYDNDIEDISFSLIRLRSDRNLWDCLWLHEFAVCHPEKFRILQYEKYISKINVNGLECIPAEKPNVPVIAPQKPKNPNPFINVSTYTLVYGSPWEYKRNQRAEALIIVFMLPLGIALLFLLLYMWIYCQKIFHLSYYQGISCIQQCPASNRPNQRLDGVRQLPQNPVRCERKMTTTPLKSIAIDKDDEDYEVPINSIISECNCMAQPNDNEIFKCQKSVHITYVHLPTEEPPHKIYEDIIEVESQPHNDKQTYDALTV